MEVVSIMQYDLSTGRKAKPVPSESELQSQPDPLALQKDDPDPIEAPKPSRPKDPRTTSVREKAMAASAPGTEYWLP
jgi:hypothetical protein